MGSLRTAFIGDSLMAYRDWSGLFKESLNHGVAGETAEGLAGRIDALVKDAPAHIVMMIGINDLLQNRRVDAIKEDYLRIFKAMPAHSGLFVVSLLPVIADASTQHINENVIILNRWLATQARQRGFTYLDLHASNVDNELGLHKEYTVDGIHLNEKGYRIFEKMLASYLP